MGTALLLLSWTFVLGPLWRHTDLSTAGGVVTLAYPFGDVIILFLIVLTLRSSPTRGGGRFMWVLLGLFAMAVADSTYAYLLEVGRYATGNLIDTGWVLGYLAIAAGASTTTGKPRACHREPDGVSLASLVTPYVPVLVAALCHHGQVGAPQKGRPSLVADRFRPRLVSGRPPIAPVRRPPRRARSPPKAVLGAIRGREPDEGPLPAATDLFEAGPGPQFLRRAP